MPDISMTTAITSSLDTSQYGLLSELQTTNPILSNASPTAGSSAAQTDTPTGDTVTLSAESRQLAAAMPPTVLATTKTDLSPIDATSAQQLGKAVLVGSATTQSGRKVTIEQYNPATVADDGTAPQPRPTSMVTIAATDQQEQQRYMLTGNTIINEDENGALHVSAYTPGQETDGNDIIIGLLATSLSGGAGDDTLFDFSRGSMGNISGGTGDDTIIVSGDRLGGTIDAGDGNDTVVITGNVMGSNIATGDGNDTVNIAGNVMNGTISLGAGNDSLQAKSLSGYIGQLTVNTGDGNDHIQAAVIGQSEGQTNIDTGNGNDLIDAAYIGLGGGQVNIATGDGNDTVHTSWLGLGIGGGNSQINVTTGSGNDSVNASWIGVGISGGSSQVNIDTGDGNDSVHSSWIGTGFDRGKTQVNIGTGAGNDSVSSSWLGVSVGGSSQVNIDTGSGNDVVRAGWTASAFSGSTQVNIATGSGNDYVNAGIVGLHLESQAKMEVMRDLVRNATDEKGTTGSSHGGDALQINASGITILTGGSANMARRGSNAYQAQGQTDDATTGSATLMLSGLRTRNS